MNNTEATKLLALVDQCQAKVDTLEVLLDRRDKRISDLVFRYRQAGMNQVADDILEAYLGRPVEPGPSKRSGKLHDA